MRHDLLAALRALRRAPGFALLAALTLALGVGAATAVYSAVDAVLLRPLPYAEPARAVAVRQLERDAGGRGEVAPGVFVDLQERSRSFAALGAADPYGFDLRGPDGMESVPAWLVTRDFFAALGARAALGRLLRPDDYAGAGARVVVLGDALWRRRFGADPRVVGRTVVLDGAPYAVAGVLTPGVRLPGGAVAGDRAAWAPKVVTPGERERRGRGYWVVVGRLRPGVTPAAAAREAAAVGARVAAEHPRAAAGLGLTAVPLHEATVGRARPALVALLGGAVALLIAACANVAGLVLARSARDARGLAVRAAVGARAGHLVRHLGAEALVLALLGGAGGAAVAAWGVGALRAAAPPGLPRADELAVDGRVLAAALAVALLAGAMVSAAPAWRAARVDPRAALAGGARTTGSRAHRRARGGLVAGQLALALVLVAGAGLLVRSVAALARADRGFRAEHVAAATLHAWQQFPREAERAEFVRVAVDQLAQLPGVRAAGAASTLPLASPIGLEQVLVAVDGRPLPTDREARGALLTAATAGYFDALRIPLRRGRLLAATDDARGEPVAVVNEAFARRFFPGVDPVGRTVRYQAGRAETQRRVVGVVADVQQRAITEPAGPALFVPHAQAPTGSVHFVVRTAGDPALALPAVRRTLAAFAPSTPVAEATTLDALVADALRERVFLLRLLGVFGGAALVLAAVGVYAALSERAAERRREIGVRVALGATAGDATRLVLADGARVAGLGLAAGALAFLGAGRVLAAQLYGVGPRDPAVLAGGALLLGAAALAASWLPARRAARVDPAAVLRAE